MSASYCVATVLSGEYSPALSEGLTWEYSVDYQTWEYSVDYQVLYSDSLDASNEYPHRGYPVL